MVKLKKDQVKIFLDVIKSIFTLLLVIATLVGVIWIALGFYNDIFGKVPDITVPSVINTDIVEAKHKIEALGLKLEVQEDYSEKVQKDMIISQKPEAGKRVKIGRKVFVVVSLGGERLQVPNLKGLSLRDAEEKLNETGLKCIVEKEMPHEEIPAGRIIEQNPPALSQAGKNTTIQVILSKGPQNPREVPDLVGVNFQDAKNAIEKAGFIIGKIVWIEDTRFAPGTVITQLPLPKEQLKPGSLISLEVVAERRAENNILFQQDLITIIVPKSEKEVDVDVLLIDRYGTTRVYHAGHKGGEKFEVNVTTIGGGKLEIYYDGAIGAKADL